MVSQRYFGGHQLRYRAVGLCLVRDLLELIGGDAGDRGGEVEFRRGDGEAVAIESDETNPFAVLS